MWHKYVEFLDDKAKIFVTGCQRSGTTIVANILSEELGLNYVDEEDYGVHNFNRMLRVTDTLTNFVIHAPALSHEVLALPDDFFVVWVRRNMNDIIASQERIGWTKHEEWREKEKYKNKFGIVSKMPICEIKTHIWETEQKNKVDYLEVWYENFDTHSLWLKDRANFNPRQISYDIR